MKQLVKILILEDSDFDAEIVQRLLLKKKLQYEFHLAIDKATYLLALDQFRPDIILSDHSLPGFNSADALAIARQRFPGIPFIMVTGTVSEEFAANIMKLGADDYILKDRLARLPAAIDTVLHLRKTEKEKLEAIKKSEAKYRTLVEQAFDSIIIYTPDFIIVDCNNIACSVLGYTSEELKDHNITELFFKEDLVARPLYFETLKAGRRTLDYRRLKKKDGTDIEMEIGTKMMPDGNLMAIARDITERKKAEQKIIRSETNLRTIFENTSEGFLLMDRNGVVIAFNNKAAGYFLFGHEKEIEIGRSVYDFIDESRKMFFRGIIAKAANGEGIQYERSYDVGNGNVTWIDFSVTPVIEAGEVRGICIAGRDITEKKIIEQEREFNRNNLKALINNTNDLMWSVDRDFKLITSNEAFDRAVRTTSGKIIAPGSDLLSSGLDREQVNRFRKHYERAFSGESFIVIEQADFPDDLWLEISFYPIYSGNDTVGAACFSRDITERKKEQKEIADYKNALDQSSIVSITNEKGIIKYVNDNFCKISGYLATELLGKDHRIINSGYHPDTYINNLWATIARGRIWRGEFRNQAKDMTLYWVDATIIPFLSNKGNPIQYLAITNDITEKKLMEKEIIAQKIEEQKKIARAIIKAQEKERNYLGQELHDNINQILASAKMYLDVGGTKNDEIKEIIRYPMELINSSISEIRLLSSNLVTPLKNIDLEDLVLKLLSKLEQSAMIKTEFAYSVSDESLSDDLKLNIYRILQEQLNNIAKHAEAKKVSVSVKAGNNIIDVVVTDDGKGFDVNKKRKGIGISNMINRIKSFNGDVEIISVPGKGCRIGIKAPY
jgi:PAS domain S-box-containing protein